MTQEENSRDLAITEVIAEFSEILAFSRSRWARYAAAVNPALRGGTMMVLHCISRLGAVSATEIRQHLDMDKAMLSRHIAKLRDHGLVRAEPDAADGRVTLLSVTETADAQIQEIRAEWARGYHDRFESWAEEDILALKAALHRFNESRAESGVAPAASNSA